MNQYPDFSITPDLSIEALSATLARLLVPGNLMDSRLGRYCAELDRYHLLSLSTSPAPPWSPGLIITPEMRRQCEIYLPLARILPALRYLILKSCRHTAYLPAVALFAALSWPDILADLPPACVAANPAELLRSLSADEISRQQFLAACFVPKRYGGGFGRYRRQMSFLAQWLRSSRTSRVHILDAACGSGEQCYEIAAMLLDAGMAIDDCTIEGVTIEPLELASAAHGWFPHDPVRQEKFRLEVGRIGTACRSMVRFRHDDVSNTRKDSIFDVIICNGLLGGPLLNEKHRLATVIAGLAAKIKKGGLLLAADRFHDGWRKVIPLEMLLTMLTGAGMSPVWCDEGLAAVKP